MNELEQVANSTFVAILGRMAAYSGKTMKWDEVLNGKELYKTTWVEDTFPKDFNLNIQDLPVDSVPVPGKWRPKTSRA